MRYLLPDCRLKLITIAYGIYSITPLHNFRSIFVHNYDKSHCAIYTWRLLDKIYLYDDYLLWKSWGLHGLGGNSRHLISQTLTRLIAEVKAYYIHQL